MKKFSRLTIIVMAMTVIMTLLAGCGKTDSTSSNETRTLTYKDQRIRYRLNPNESPYCPTPYSTFLTPLTVSP